MIYCIGYLSSDYVFEKVLTILDESNERNALTQQCYHLLLRIEQSHDNDKGGEMLVQVT